MNLMAEALNTTKYERPVTPLERMFYQAPYSIVTVVARIKGNITENMLKDAVSKVQQRHTNLRVRIKKDNEHKLKFTMEGVGNIPIEIVPRESDDHWMEVFDKECRVPFEFNIRPAIRFILVQSPEISELVIFCHHIICDGLSLAYLARDLMVHLGDPTREVKVLPPPDPIDRDNLPTDVSVNFIVKFFINRINKAWEKDRIFFDHEDYRDLNEAYWTNYNHKMHSIELTEDQTSAIVKRCKQEGVTVNTALTAAFVGAQPFVQGDRSFHSSIAVAGSVRDRLLRPVGEVIGYFAGAVTLEFKYNRKKSFWDNARVLHRKVKPRYSNKDLFAEPLIWCYLAPGIMEALSFKLIGRFVPPDAASYQKLSEFSKRKDIVSSTLKRGGLDDTNKMTLGTAVTNLTRMDFPREYGSLELDRLIMNPGGAFPLSNVNLVVGAVTCSGKLSILLEHAEETIDTETVKQIRDKGLEFLLEE